MQNKTFVHQLHSILGDPTVNGLIYWQSDDMANVFVLRPYHPQFGETVLRRYFKHGNVSSFVRQLHMYGFHKVGNNSVNRQSNYDEGTPVVSKKQPHFVLWKFSHPSGLFHREADFDTLCKITRKSVGLGKDGKRKNILSPVAVNYISASIKQQQQQDPSFGLARIIPPETQLLTVTNKNNINNINNNKNNNNSNINSNSNNNTSISNDNNDVYTTNTINPKLASTSSVYEITEGQEECLNIDNNNSDNKQLIGISPGVSSLIDSNLFILKKTTLVIIDILGQLNNKESELKSDDICENLQKLQELKLELINTQTALINITNSSTNINVTAGNILQQNLYPTPSQYSSVQNYFPQM